MSFNHFRINRLEAAGAMGDLGSLLPITIGMILINRLNPIGIFLSIGLFYILSVAYYKITVPVQPMKVITAYAIATTMTQNEILASSAIMGLSLLLIGATNIITLIGRYIHKPVVLCLSCCFLKTGSFRLLLFAGAQLAMTIIDLKKRNDLFVVLLILGVTLTSNLAIGFVVGIAFKHALKIDRLKI